ncbi:SH3 domain-containing protein [Streptomyces incarnatus]|uniref:SH3 domain-containing protein n=1 Tax=Streptomyces incarnatus TaxID=665007 RepID=UPI000B1FB9C3|nr:SH3 domain-containing protein [Streptomyces incarnatus]
MIRRTLQSGLLAAVAVLALLPTAAGATTADAAAQRPVPGATSQHQVHRAQHRTHRTAGRVHHRRYVAHHRHHRAHLRTHHARRTHRIHRLTARRTAYFMPQTAAYRLAMHRLQYRLAAHWMTHRHIKPLTGRVATRHTVLNVRSGPGTGYRVIGHRQRGRVLALTCRTRGSWVHGNRTWYRLPHHGGYVSAHYVRPSRSVPWC